MSGICDGACDGRRANHAACTASGVPLATRLNSPRGYAKWQAWARGGIRRLGHAVTRSDIARPMAQGDTAACHARRRFSADNNARVVAPRLLLPPPVWPTRHAGL